MQSTPSEDIDFCLWGPFADPILPCPMNNSNGGLTGNKVVSCSYSGSATENAVIPNGQTGEYYILVITNYSNDPCNITFQKTAGTGTTDCTILPPPASSNSPICVGETLQLNAALVGGASYQWTGPNGFSSSLQNPQVPDIQYANAGIYSLTITVDGQTSDPSTTEVVVVDPPVGTLSLVGNASICKGDSTQLTITATGPAPYAASIGTGSGMPILVQFLSSPHTFWVKPVQNTVYTLNVITNLGCSGTTSGQAAVTVRPLPEPAFTTSVLCSGKQITFTDQSSIASGSIASWAWNFGDGSNATVQNPVHVYANAGNYDISLGLTSNTGCMASLVLPVIINPTPQVNAGNDKTIAYGTNIQLDGTASGGSGSHTYQWMPSDKVDNPAILTPATTLLEQSTDYTLTATDNGNGCQKSDMMTVTVTGGPLTTNIVASPSEICIGGSTLLNATPTGGSGNYTYTWTSDPAGYSSSLQDITVQPLFNTTYKLKIFDGFTYFDAQILVVVHPLPEVGITPVDPVLHGTTAMLSSNIISGAQPFEYVWEPGSKVVDPVAAQTETTNLYQSQSFMLTVTDNNGCVSGAQTDVTITGTELEVNPITDNPVICLKDTATLRAVPGGGSNDYVSFTWTGTDGFSSNAVAPKVSPATTTYYTVEVNDGFNIATGQLTVTVNPLPFIDLIPYDDPRVQHLGNGQIGICVYDTVTLDAGNPGQDYLWSNGSTDKSVKISTSGLSFDEQFYQVSVTNIETGCAEDAEITAYFTFQNCSYGVDELQFDKRMIVYPNPSLDGNFNVLLSDLNGEMSLEVYSMLGKRLFTQFVELRPNNSQEISVDLSAFSAGVYFIKLTGNDELIFRSLIISE
jgi:PKD repeat protein